jgi:hypothetical protein
MRMTLHVTFPTYSGTRGGVSGADRPLCALVQAWAHRRGKLGGELKGRGEREIDARLRAAFEAFGVSREVVNFWTALTLIDTGGMRRDICDWHLDEYQIAALGRTHCAGGVFALDCGLGKTPVALAAAYHLGKTVGGRLVVVCPLNAVPVWEKVIDHPDMRVFSDRQILSQDSLHKAVGLSGTVLIIDEAHGMGDAKSQRTTHAHDLRAKFLACFCLTGSLLHAGIEKALSILDLAVPGASRFTTKWDAGRVFQCLVKKPMGQRTVTSLATPTGANADLFNRWLEPYVTALAADSDAVRKAFYLPNQTVDVVELEGCAEPVADLVLRTAQQIMDASGEWPSMPQVAHAVSAAGVVPKLDWLLEALEADSRPVVVFYQYTVNGDAICEALTQSCHPYVRIDGAVTGRDRSGVIDTFVSGRVRVLVAQIDAASVSMNLQNAWTSVQFDPTWKGAAYTQLLARTCRRGQTRECEHYVLVANKFQKRMHQTVVARADFNASVADWQEAKQLLEAPRGTPDLTFNNMPVYFDLTLPTGTSP